MKKNRAITSPAGAKFTSLPGASPAASNRAMLGRRIRDGHSEVAIAVAQVVGRRAALVDREFQFEGAFGARQVDQGEVRKIQPIRHVEVEGIAIEIDRALFIKHADHAVDRLGQVSLLSDGRGSGQDKTKAQGVGVVWGYYRRRRPVCGGYSATAATAPGRTPDAMNTMQAVRNNEVKFSGSPRRLNTRNAAAR